MNIVNFGSSESVVDFNFKRVIEKFILCGKLNLMQIPSPPLALPRTSLLIRDGSYQRNNLLHRFIIHDIKHFLLPDFLLQYRILFRHILVTEFAPSCVRPVVAFCNWKLPALHSHSFNPGA